MSVVDLYCDAEMQKKREKKRNKNTAIWKHRANCPHFIKCQKDRCKKTILIQKNRISYYFDL